MISNLNALRLGAVDGAAAVILLVAVLIAFAMILALVIVNAIKSLKEKKDEKEDLDERTFYAEYGVLPEEVRLNQRVAVLRNKLKRGEYSQVSVEEDAVDEQPVSEPQEPVVAVAPVEQPVEEPVEEVAAEQAVEPVQEEVKEEQKEEPVVEEQPVEEPQEPVAEEAPVEEKAEPVVEEEPEKQGVDKPEAKKKVVKKKPDDWSKYDGEYEGYYYDPEDACYYEGKPSAALAKKLAAKQAEIEAENAKSGKKVIIKKIAPPFATLKTPKHPRQTPVKIEGFDEGDIYGKYVIEHVGEEYFYTLYSSNGDMLYESGNYSTLEYCKRAIVRFKTHAIVGTYTIENIDGKFDFVIKRKTYVHRGAPHDTFEQAQAHSKRVKDFAQTDVIREQ